jgi:hypothetical protein
MHTNVLTKEEPWGPAIKERTLRGALNQDVDGHSGAPSSK